MELLKTLFIVLCCISYVLSGTVYRVKVSGNLNIRRGAGTGYKIIDKLKNNQYIYATSVSKGWAKFYKGWVSTDYLVKVTSGTPYVATGDVNCRTGPTTNYTIITTAKKGNTVNYFGKDPFSTWSVTSNGYVSSYYLKPRNSGNNNSNTNSNGSLGISQRGINLIKEFEGCRLTAYWDSNAKNGGCWTIGYGTTNADKAITGTTITKGMKISQATADEWLRRSVNKKYGVNVNKFDHIYHWTQNEFDALCSFAYNIGSINGLVNNGKRSKSSIPSEMLLYNKGTVNGKKQVLKGLVRRRNAEVNMFKGN